MVRLSGGLLIEGAGFPASVQDVDEPARRPPQDVVAFDSVGGGVVVDGAAPGEAFRAEEAPARPGQSA